MNRTLDVIFRPRSIALIGASRDPGSMSGSLWRNLRGSFQGPLFAVNPHARELDGLPVYPSVRELPQPVDLAFIAVPASQVLTVARECLERGVRGLVVITAGFSETGQAGQAREGQLAALARAAGVPLVGPNCLGILNTDPGWPLNGAFSLPAPPPGPVAVGTQSGALGFVFPDYIRRWQLGLSQLLSTGNKADVGENELLAHWEEDPATRVIQLYLESFQQPRQFLAVARRVARRKPIVVLKAGRTASGQRAAGSHTAALASPEAAAAGLLAQSGVLSVGTLRELFETTVLLATQPLPAGRRVAVLTNAGGPGVLCADTLEALGLEVPEWSAALQSQLRTGLPDECSLRNPVDLIGSTDPRHFRHCLAPLLHSTECDAVVVIYVPRLPGTSDDVARAIVETIEQNADNARPRPVLAVFMQTSGPPDPLRGSRCQVPSFDFPEAAAAALARAARYQQWLREPPGRSVVPSGFLADGARQLLQAVLDEPASDGQWLAPDRSQRLLEACGIPVPDWQLTHSPDTALQAARRIGYPLVLKAVAPGLLHKRAAGAIALDLRSDDELRAACRRLRQAVPLLDGLLVQRYVPGGCELMIGVRRDASFGHLIGCGWGGSQVERLRRFGFRLHPLTDGDAGSLLREQLADAPSHTFGWASNSSSPSGAEPAESPALLDAVLRVNALVTAVPELAEADLNPVKLLDDGRLVCLDARFFLRF